MADPRNARVEFADVARIVRATETGTDVMEVVGMQPLALQRTLIRAGLSMYGWVAGYITGFERAHPVVTDDVRAFIAEYVQGIAAHPNRRVLLKRALASRLATDTDTDVTRAFRDACVDG
jgi:hypothetical protein